MKIRIQDNSVRFRISLKELEELARTGSLEAYTEVYAEDSGACEGRFSYGLRVVQDRPSRCVFEPGAVWLELQPEDLATLQDPGQEGVYLRREARLPSGGVKRFIAFAEKDRPASKCDKPEEWVYDYGEARAARAG